MYRTCGVEYAHYEIIISPPPFQCSAEYLLYENKVSSVIINLSLSRVMESHQDAMKEQLKDALEWYLSDKDPEIRKEVPKLEARYTQTTTSQLGLDLTACM